MNSDQTPLKYAPLYSQTLAEKGSKNVGISGMTYRKLLTATFGITFSNTFLQIQLIYGGKTTQGIPRTKFLESFSLSANVKHFSNTTKSIKLIHEIILTYVERERRCLNSKCQSALLIIDVCRGQIQQPVLDLLKENNILLVCVQANMTYISAIRSHRKQMFTEWCFNEIKLLLENWD